jgi:NAD(P)H dehydrogenase (quinone)
MNVLIVYAHSEPKSFTAAMKNLAVETLTRSGHAVRLSDLYAMQFAPAGGPGDSLRLSDEKFFNYLTEQAHASATGLFAPDVAAEMEKVVWADFLILQFPLWWFSLPAILKGWIDRAFAIGFAYDIDRAYEQGPFRGNCAMLAFTTGGPPAVYGPGGTHGSLDDLLFPIQHGMLYFVGMEVLPPFVAYAVERCSPEERASALSADRERLLHLKETPPIDFSRPACGGTATGTLAGLPTQ